VKEYRFPEPQDVHQAMVQANISARAEKLWEEGYTYEEQTGTVISPKGQRYHVDCEADSCSCEAIKHHGDCKHRIAVAKLNKSKKKRAA